MRARDSWRDCEVREGCSCTPHMTFDMIRAVDAFITTFITTLITTAGYPTPVLSFVVSVVSSSHFRTFVLRLVYVQDVLSLPPYNM
jgi:hypothetical protein